MSKLPQARSLATIDKVLDAAEALLARDGFGSLTMDAVAFEAGVSKGGVLHHFRSKDALVSSLARRKLKSLQDGVDAAQARRAGAPQAVLQGMVDYARTTYCGDDNFSRPILVAAVENSESLAVFQGMCAELFGDVRGATAAPEVAAVLVFATIGVQLARTLGIAQLGAAEAEAVFGAISTLAAALPPADASV